MPRDEIPRSSWSAFCEAFSRQHEGWLVSVALRKSLPRPVQRRGRGTAPREAAAGAEDLRTIATEAPLQSLTEQGGKLLLVLGRGDKEIRQEMEAPDRLFFRTTDAGWHEGLQVDSYGGTSILVLFRVPALPEMVDGAAASAGLACGSRGMPGRGRPRRLRGRCRRSRPA